MHIKNNFQHFVPTLILVGLLLTSCNATSSPSTEPSSNIPEWFDIEMTEIRIHSGV